MSSVFLYEVFFVSESNRILFDFFKYDKTPEAVQRMRRSKEHLKLSIRATWTAAGSAGNYKTLSGKGVMSQAV